MSEIRGFKELNDKLVKEKDFSETESESIVKSIKKMVNTDVVLMNDDVLLNVFLTNTFSDINRENAEIHEILKSASSQLTKIQETSQYEIVKQQLITNDISANFDENSKSNFIEKFNDVYDGLSDKEKYEFNKWLLGKETIEKLDSLAKAVQDGNIEEVKKALGCTEENAKILEEGLSHYKNNINEFKLEFTEMVKHIASGNVDEYINETYQNDPKSKEFWLLLAKTPLLESIKEQEGDQINTKINDIMYMIEQRSGVSLEHILKNPDRIDEIINSLESAKEEQVEGNSKRTIKGFWTNIKQKIFSGPKGLKEKLFGKKEQSVEKDEEKEPIIQEPTNLDSIIKALVTQSKGQISEEELNLTLETLTDIMSEEIGFFTKEISSLSVISISERISKEIENKAEIAQYLESFNDYKTIETMVKHIEQLSNDRINSDVDAGRTITVGDETWGTYVITKFEQECENKGYNTEFFDFLDTIDPRSGKIDLSKLLENTKNEIYPGKELTDADAQSLGEQAGIEEIDISALESLYEFAENPEATMEGLEAETMEESDPEKVEESAEPESREDDEGQAKSAKAEEEERKAEEERQAQEKAKQDAEEKKRAEAERVAAEEKKKQEQQETENKSTALVEYRRPGFFARVKNFFKNIKSQGIRGAFAESFMTKEWAYEKEDIADNNSEHKVANTEEQNLSQETAKQTQQKAVEVKQNLQEQGATKDTAEKIGEDLAANNTSLNAVEGKDEIKNSNANEHPNNSEKYSSAKTNDWLTTNPEYMKKSNEVGKNAGKKLSEVSKTTDKTLDNPSNASQNKDDGR